MQLSTKDLFNQMHKNTNGIAKQIVRLFPARQS